MSLRLRADDGALAVWTPAAPPQVLLDVETSGAGPLTAARAHAAADAARGALAFLGFEPIGPAAGPADLRVSVAGGPGPRLVVAAASVEDGDYAARGFSPDDFHYFCLKTHPRKPLAFDWGGMSAARAELGSLRAAARSLSGVTLESSSRGVTGYQHRFREALSRDFDFPEALSTVWDGLRPGALSPGSRAAFLRAALPALGLEDRRTGGP